jgi:hypothetical protein
MALVQHGNAVGLHVRCAAQTWVAGETVHPGSGEPFCFTPHHTVQQGGPITIPADGVCAALVRLGLQPLLSTVVRGQLEATAPGTQLELEVFHCGSKGCGVRPLRKLSKGEPACDYAGEVISTSEAKRRQQQYDEAEGMNYLLVLLEHLPDRVVRTSIDPTLRGGVARCINHSCSPNLRPGEIGNIQLGQWCGLRIIYSYRERRQWLFATAP